MPPKTKTIVRGKALVKSLQISQALQCKTFANINCSLKYQMIIDLVFQTLKSDNPHELKYQMLVKFSNDDRFSITKSNNPHKLKI